MWKNRSGSRRSAHSLELFKSSRRNSTPTLWAKAQMNLGCTLYSMREDAYREQAATAFRHALSVLTEDRAPTEWAGLQNNLALSLWSLRDHYAEAVSAFERALQVYTPDRYPLQHLTTAHNLGKCLLDSNALARAEKVLGAVIDLGTVIVRTQFSHDERRQCLRHFAGAGTDLAHTLIRQDRIADALCALARGRSILLQAAFDLPEKTAQPLVIDAFNSWSMLRVKSQNADSVILDLDSDVLETKLRIRRELNKDVVDAFSHFSYLLDQTGPHQSKPLDVDALSRALPVGGAFVALLDHAFLVLRAGFPDPSCFELGYSIAARTQKLLVNYDSEPSSGWFVAYDRFKAAEQLKGITPADVADWSDTIQRSLKALGDIIMRPLDLHLRSIGLLPGAHIVLMVPGMLSSIPLHAAETGPNQVFLDDWIVSYTPNPYTYILSEQRARANSTRAPSLLAVTNPTGDLPIAKNPAWDAFNGMDRLDLNEQEATPESVSNALVGRSHLSFYCHGTWNVWDADQSALMMAEKQPLTVAKLRKVDLSSARLAVLAACETGLNDMTNTIDEFIGLPSALLQAGVPCVISSNWPVEASATNDLITRLFRLHLTGASPASALRQAQIGVRRGNDSALGDGSSGSIRYTHPIYWAGFTSTGI